MDKDKNILKIILYQSFFTISNIAKNETIKNEELDWFFKFYFFFINEIIDILNLEIKKEFIQTILSNIKDDKTNIKNLFNLYNYIITYIFKKKNLYKNYSSSEDSTTSN